MRVCPIALCLGLSTTLGLAGCVTSQSVGMDSFTQASNRCHDPYTYYSCMEGNAVSQNFTPAEHQLIAFQHLVIEKSKKRRHK
jgi:hypothetical protein